MMTEKPIQVADILTEPSRQYLRLLLLCAGAVAKCAQVREALAGFDRFMVGQCDLQQAIKTPCINQQINTINLTRPLAPAFLTAAIKHIQQQGATVRSLLPWIDYLLEKECASKVDTVVKIITEEPFAFTRNITSITLAGAKKLAEQAEIRAQQINVPMTIAVLDPSCNMILHQRMEGALQTSVKVAFNKAYTAASFKVPSSELAKLIQPGAELYGIQHSDPLVVGFGGGFPIWIDGQLIGGFGVAGGDVEQDMEVARFALKQVLAIEI